MKFVAVKYIAIRLQHIEAEMDGNRDVTQLIDSIAAWKIRLEYRHMLIGSSGNFVTCHFPKSVYI